MFEFHRRLEHGPPRNTPMVYEAVKADTVAQLPLESQLFAKAMQEHMHLPHIHNALAFADIREGEPYEITVTVIPGQGFVTVFDAQPYRADWIRHLA
jgi:hypothetical protein